MTSSKRRGVVAGRLAQGGRLSRAGDRVGTARRRHRENADHAVAADSIAAIGLLRGKRRRVVVHDGTQCIVERQVLAARRQREVGVQRRAGAVLRRRPDHDRGIGRQRQGGDRPLDEVLVVVGEVPAGEVDRLCRRVPQLEPVAVVAVVVDDRGGVRRHQLGDDHMCRRGECWRRVADVEHDGYRGGREHSARPQHSTSAPRPSAAHGKNTTF